MLKALKTGWAAVREKLRGEKYREPLKVCPVPEFVEVPTISKYNGIDKDIKRELEATRQAATDVMASLVKSSEEARYRLQLIFDNLGDAVLLLDSVGKITACNLTSRRLLGVTSDALLGKTLQVASPEFESLCNVEKETNDYLEYLKSHPCCEKCAAGKTDECSQDQMAAHYEAYTRTGDTCLRKPRKLYYHRADGAVIPLQLTLNVLTLHPDGSDFGYVLVLRDLTASSHLEDNVLHMQSASSNLMSLLSVPVFYKDSDYRFTSVNRPFCDLLHVSDAEVIGKTAYDVFEPECADKLAELDVLAASSKETQQVTLDLRTLKGIVRTANVLSKAIRAGHRVTGLTGSIVVKGQFDDAFRANVFAAVSKSIVFLDSDNKIVGCNDEFLRLIGLPKSDVVGAAASSPATSVLLSDCELFSPDSVTFNGITYGRLRLPVINDDVDTSNSVYVLFQHI